MQGSLPAGWLAFTGRASNSLDRCKRFQIISSSSSGFSLAQGKFHDSALPRAGQVGNVHPLLNMGKRLQIDEFRCEADEPRNSIQDKVASGVEQGLPPMSGTVIR